MTDKSQVISSLQKHQHEFHTVVPYHVHQDKLLLLDFTENNKELTDEILNDTNKFSAYINNKLQSAGCKYGIGGYAEPERYIAGANILIHQLQTKNREDFIWVLISGAQ